MVKQSKIKPSPSKQSPLKKRTVGGKLTPKQSIYIQALLDGSNKSEAAREAYPAAQYPNVQGYKVLQNDSVRHALLARLEKGNHINKIGDYLDSVMNDPASQSSDTSERHSTYDRQHRASDLIIKVVGAYAPTKSVTADITDCLIPQRSKAR